MKKTTIYYILATLLMAAVAFLFFYPDDIQGNVLQQSDIQQGVANGEEGRAFHEATGETTRWTDSLFGGMPNFQISPSYPAGALLDWIAKVYTLGLPSPANLLFSMMLGFFIMCLCMKMRWSAALFGALAWGFSSYFIIIIGAGHIWKFVTLAYIPPTIGGLALAYRGKYLGGGALTALFGALQLQSNHPQMTYYFLLVVLALAIGWFVNAWRRKEMRRWVCATLVSLAAGLLAVGANAPSLYNSYEYSKETVRGRATLIAAPGSQGAKAGMSKEAITAWSYGVDETFTLLIPNVKGGASIKPVASENRILSVAETDKAEEMASDGRISQQEYQFMTQFPQYFGDQPMTNGPVYVGAFVLLLAILAMFTVQGPVKWALFAVAILAILLSWGHNFEPFTNFFIDFFPGYNKFRTVSSILVVVEFIVPLLAVMCVGKMISDKDYFARYKWTIYTVFGLGAFVCLIGWIWPSIFGSPFGASEIEQLKEMGVWTAPEYSNIWHAIGQARLDLVRADSLRSLLFIVMGSLVTILYLKRAYTSGTMFALALGVVVVIDLYPLNKRYVNSENFVEPMQAEATFTPTEADKAILKDKGHYRVLDVAGFDAARSSYFHKTLGGYHAAKLTRYNDLITHQIRKGNPGVINMLNAKYVLNGEQYQLNPEAYGAAWFVDGVDYVGSPNAEMSALDSLDTRHRAVATSEFERILGKSAPAASGDTIRLRTYAPNRLTYAYKLARPRVAVFSEIWFPWGWEATVDGKPAQIGRVNYVLRALNLPAGSHTVEFRFDPKSVRVTDSISYVAIALIYAALLAAVSLWVYRLVKRGREPKEKK